MSSSEVMELTLESRLAREEHEATLVELKAKQRAFAVDVPVLPEEVRKALRQMGHPVKYFGENLADVRNRLRMILAKQDVIQKGGVSADIPTAPGMDKEMREEEEEEATKYTRASPELIEAREAIAKFSIQRAKMRLSRERRLRVGAKRKLDWLIVSEKDKEEEEDEHEAEISALDAECAKLYKSLRGMSLEGSQYGDARAMSAICTSTADPNKPIICTGSWSASLKLWDGSSPTLDLMGETKLAHEDRIMGVACSEELVATASIDLTAKLWKIRIAEDTMTDEGKEEVSLPYLIQEAAHLKGHQRRLCKVAFHPMSSEYLATTSFDHTWRLWNTETQQQLLLQDGHAREVFGVGFHPDGSLAATTDFGGVVHNWDLRSGKTIHHFLGHAKRVLCCEYSPNGFQLATAGDDGTVKMWDLRKRKQVASVPAHLNLITQLQFSDEYLASSSFDGTAKLWSTRDWKMLSTLRGHEGKVMGIGLLPGSVVTSGYDKTLKLWQ